MANFVDNTNNPQTFEDGFVNGVWCDNRWWCTPEVFWCNRVGLRVTDIQGVAINLSETTANAISLSDTEGAIINFVDNNE